MRIYRAGLCTSGFTSPAGLLAERSVHDYLAFLNLEKAPATRAKTLREALNVLGGFFEADVREVAASTRVRGLCTRLLRTRAPLRQRRPLTVRLVGLLDTAATHKDDTIEKVIAGTALSAVFGRARVGDLARSTSEPVLGLSVSDY